MRMLFWMVLLTSVNICIQCICNPCSMAHMWQVCTAGHLQPEAKKLLCTHHSSAAVVCTFHGPGHIASNWIKASCTRHQGHVCSFTPHTLPTSMSACKEQPLFSRPSQEHHQQGTAIYRDRPYVSRINMSEQACTLLARHFMFQAF